MLTEDSIVTKLCAEMIGMMNGILSVNEEYVKIILKPSMLISYGSSSSSNLSSIMSLDLL